MNRFCAAALKTLLLNKQKISSIITRSKQIYFVFPEKAINYV